MQTARKLKVVLCCWRVHRRSCQSRVLRIDNPEHLGHSTPAMVRRYSATYDAEKAARAHEQFSPADRMGERMR